MFNIVEYISQIIVLILRITKITGGLILTELGETCEGRGLLPIDTLDECRSNKKFIRRYYPTYSHFVGHENRSDYPTGCYVWINRIVGEYKGVFNSIPSGAGNGASRAVCKGAKGRIPLYMLSNILIQQNYI